MYRPHAARFRDEGLLQYAVLSLLANERMMAKVRHIYVLTSGEIPTCAAPPPRTRRTSATLRAGVKLEVGGNASHV